MKASIRAASVVAVVLLCMTAEHPEAFDPPMLQLMATPPTESHAATSMQGALLTEVLEKEGVIMEDYGYMIGAESAIEPMHMAPSGYLAEQYDSRFALQSPVPEPETYAMLLSGAALLGFKYRRKTQSS